MEATIRNCACESEACYLLATLIRANDLVRPGVKGSGGCRASIPVDNGTVSFPNSTNHPLKMRQGALFLPIFDRFHLLSMLLSVPAQHQDLSLNSLEIKTASLPNPRYIYIPIIYTPNLGLMIAVFVQEREQSCFRRSRAALEGAPREHGEALREHEGAARAQHAGA